MVVDSGFIDYEIGENFIVKVVKKVSVCFGVVDLDNYMVRGVNFFGFKGIEIIVDGGNLDVYIEGKGLFF